VKDFRAPNEEQTVERSWQVVRAAYESRVPVTWPRRHWRPLAVGALAAAAVAAVLSPPGRSVVNSLRKAVGVEHAETSLFSVPAGGHLLVTGRGGTWIVRPDGSRRRLGDYRDAAWSPHGLFIAATRGDELAAIDPKGTVRWSLPRRNPRFPRWIGTRSDTRIAYIAGGRLHIVAGDGTGDYEVGPAAAVAPAWRQGRRRGRLLAYAKSARVIVYSADARAAFLVKRFGGARKLAWSDDGRLFLVLGPRGVRVFGLQGVLFAEDHPPAGSVDVDAAFLPGTHRVAAIRVTRSSSRVVLLNSKRTIFAGTGAFRQLLFSPNGRWVLITWPTANQWVFVHAHPRKIVGAARISNQFGAYPRISGWCCGG
jgi:hypothetical protein